MAKVIYLGLIAFFRQKFHHSRLLSLGLFLIFIYALLGCATGFVFSGLITKNQTVINSAIACLGFSGFFTYDKLLSAYYNTKAKDLLVMPVSLRTLLWIKSFNYELFYLATYAVLIFIISIPSLVAGANVGVLLSSALFSLVVFGMTSKVKLHFHLQLKNAGLLYLIGAAAFNLVFLIYYYQAFLNQTNLMQMPKIFARIFSLLTFKIDWRVLLIAIVGYCASNFLSIELVYRSLLSFEKSRSGKPKREQSFFLKRICKELGISIVKTKILLQMLDRKAFRQTLENVATIAFSLSCLKVLMVVNDTASEGTHSLSFFVIYLSLAMIPTIYSAAMRSLAVEHAQIINYLQSGFSLVRMVLYRVLILFTFCMAFIMGLVLLLFVEGFINGVTELLITLGLVSANLFALILMTQVITNAFAYYQDSENVINGVGMIIASAVLGLHFTTMSSVALMVSLLKLPEEYAFIFIGGMAITSVLVFMVSGILLRRRYYGEYKNYI